MEERADKPTSTSSDDDDVLREQKFKRPQGLNLDSFMVGAAPEAKEETPVESPPSNEPKTDSSDAAVGEVRDLFTMEASQETVPDSTTQLAVHAEQTIGKGLAVAMVVVWTAIGALVGTVLPPVIGGLGLLLMAGFGL